MQRKPGPNGTNERAPAPTALGRAMPAAVALAACALAAAPSARADGVPEKGEGTITLLGGFRLIPQHGFLSTVASDGQGHTISQQQLQPQGLAILGFMPDEDLHVTIGLGYGIDRYKISDGDLSVSSFTILLGADTPLVRGPSYTLYGGGGLGYSLNTITRLGVGTESNSTAGYVALGFRYRLAGRLALVVEDRYTVATAGYPPLNASINVGGNLLSVGLQFHFFSPEDKGHPHAPGE
jgi:hypothetical protein